MATTAINMNIQLIIKTVLRTIIIGYAVIGLIMAPFYFIPITDHGTTAGLHWVMVPIVVFWCFVTPLTIFFILYGLMFVFIKWIFSSDD